MDKLTQFGAFPSSNISQEIKLPTFPIGKRYTLVMYQPEVETFNSGRQEFNDNVTSSLHSHFEILECLSKEEMIKQLSLRKALALGNNITLEYHCFPSVPTLSSEELRIIEESSQKLAEERFRRTLN